VASLTSKVARGTALLTIGANLLDFTGGENSEYGVLSTRFAAVNTVDLTTGLGLPATGAAIGTAVFPGVGTVLGGAGGAGADLLFKTAAGGAARNSVVNVVDNTYQLGVDAAVHTVNTWANGTAPLTVYPETIPSYSPYGIQPTYTYNSTIGLP
jgi:hypothetical protein